MGDILDYGKEDVLKFIQSNEKSTIGIQNQNHKIIWNKGKNTN
jgi:hypothetical protein